MNHSFPARRFARFATISVLALSVAIAHADLKVVSNTTVNTLRGPQVVSVISFFKGSKIRIDNLDVSQITDSRTGKTIYLNHSRKIYTIQSDAEIAKRVAEGLKGKRMKVTAHIAGTGKTKKIAGKNASEYVGTLTVQGDYPKIPGAQATATVHIDEWTIQDPSISVGPADMLGEVGVILKGLAGSSSMGQVTKELSKAKGIPLNLNCRIDVKITTAGGGAPQTQQHSFVTETQFVRDSILPDSLFTIPKTYKEVHDPSLDKPKTKGK